VSNLLAISALRQVTENVVAGSRPRAPPCRRADKVRQLTTRIVTSEPIA